MTTTSTRDSLWRNFQERYLEVIDVGFALDLSGLKFAPTFHAEMEPKMQAAFRAMAELEGGAIANPDEGRQVGHYWLRDPHRAPSAAIRDAIVQTNQRILKFARAVHDGAFKPEKAPRFLNVAVVGIGGSALGPQFVSQALGEPSDPMRVFFVDNTDPEGIDLVVRKLGATAGGLAATLTIVISKSGGTKETRNGMVEMARAYRAAGLAFERHAVAVTQDGSELDKVAVSGKWLERFPMWDWVGGRTSELSAVGLLPAALQGLDVAGMLEGAKAMDGVTRNMDSRRNPAAQLALAWYHATGGRGQKDMVILPYKDRLELFSRYLQQLVMESLGKEKDLAGKTVHQGIAVYGNKGSTDQHAYVQQLRDGVHNFFVTFLEVLRDRREKSMEVDPGVTSGDYLDAFYQGTRRALHESGRETLTITIDEVSPRSVGALIALYERAVGLYASLIGINAYHQPGVEAGKKAAASVLAVQAKLLAALRSRPGDAMTVEETAMAAGVDDLETAFKVLRHAAANPDHGIERTPGASPFDARYRAR